MHADPTHEVDDERPCSGPRGSIRVCHERISNEGQNELSRRRRDETYQEAWCALPAASFCWDDCGWFCSTHVNARHEGHRLERPEAD